MIDSELIINYIEKGYECEYLDFKLEGYTKQKREELLIDIMAMANSDTKRDRYIIIGVKDKSNGERIKKGLDKSVIQDQANYQQFVLNNIEPEVKFDYFNFEYGDKLYGVFRIYDTDNKPYMIKKDNTKIKKGLCKVRKGSYNSEALREDFDRFYEDKEKFEIKIMEHILAAVYDNGELARIRVTIRNLSKFPVTIQYGKLVVCDKDKNELSYHRVYRIDNKYMGADFQLNMFPKTEKLCDLYVGFSSSDCLRLNLDEYGKTEEEFVFKLILLDTLENEYCAEANNGIVHARGDVLWKVKKLSKRTRV